MSASAAEGSATCWSPADLQGLEANYTGLGLTFGDAASEYNPTPGTGSTGYLPVPPNNYPFYSDEEKYKPILQPDGGQLSEWEPMYQPTHEQAEEDRKLAYKRGVPHGYVPPGDKYAGLPTISILIASDLHTPDEYGNAGASGKHTGGPFRVSVSPTMRIEDLRKVIWKEGGVLPGLQKLSYAGKNLEDAQRTLQHYGVEYWWRKFPDWPLKIRRY
ncbi:hypothetical protein WJX84_002515 [Apatococcus fuscideae]|uniref:Ubiquitin-like domain-containing protein n=1 Tax=Apatococcus fuscideae TaxID=2026836 RepID=A0AAW1TFN5_9CHLO